MKRILSILILLLGFNVSAQDPCYSVKDFMTQTELENSSITKNFVGGWNMFGYPCSQEIDVVDAFSSIIDKVLIVKSNNGSVYMPEFGFNGIGFLEGGEGYQIKMSNTEYGFSFCEPITWPNLEGCTDCEAVNFNQWANVDDGSCNYDSDGDGVPDSEEVVGCQDSLACDYDITATDSAECIYAQDGYDCDGNLLIYVGAEAHGGIVFYYDSIGDYGLVAAMEDIGQLSWGCNGQELLGANRSFVGGGLQNSLDISQQCNELEIAATICLEHENNQYSDWFLPSIDELNLIYNNISQGSSNGNLGNFSNIVNSSLSRYISSTQFNSNEMWYADFVVNWEDNYFTDGKHIDWYHIRPIRAFGNWTMGCMDETACNFNPAANMANGSCEYPESGFHCDGSQVEIGDFYKGGIVFYIDDSNHGLICLDHDIGEYSYGYNNNMLSCANGMSIGTGLQNTICLDNHYGGNAATQCLNYEHLGYDDWYLPSRDELLEIMYTISQNSPLGNIGNFSFQSFYWSSTEETINAAYNVWFDPTYGQPIGAYGNGKQNSRKVRPIRSF